jgi:hypothetical protein
VLYKSIVVNLHKDENMFKYENISCHDKELVIYLAERGYTPLEISHQCYLQVSIVSEIIKAGLSLETGDFLIAIDKLYARRHKYRLPASSIPKDVQHFIEEKIRRNPYSEEKWAVRSLIEYFKNNGIKSSNNRTISIATIYKYIWRDKELGGDLYKYLPNIEINSESVWRTYEGPLKWMYTALKDCFEASKKTRLIYIDFDTCDLTTFIVWTPYLYENGEPVIVDVSMNDDRSGEILYSIDPSYFSKKGLFKSKLGFSKEKTLEGDVLEYARSISEFCNSLEED